MKTQLDYFLAICVASTLLISNTFGQFGINSPGSASPFEFGDKLANPAGDNSLVEARVSQPALIAFSNSFPNGTNTKWYRHDKKYLVRFVKNGNNTSALFSVKGNLIYSISYGLEKDLPRIIRKLVKKEYVEFNILQAVEVNGDDRNIWVVTLDDDESVIIARVENEVIEKMKHYRKSK